MYKLIIVDDEPSTSSGLRDCFDWGSHGVEVVGTANDGATALPLIESLRPDIVMTDVRMPLMDGTVLATKLREQGLQAKIIFISGYDDTEYLRSALRSEAVDYLLKPIQFHELAEVIDRAVSALRGENEKERLLYEMDRKLAQSFPLLREQFLCHLVRDDIRREADALGDKLAFLDLRLPLHGLFTVLVAEMDDAFLAARSQTEREQQLLSFAALNICQEIIDMKMSGYAFQLEPGRFVCILSLRSEEEEEELYALIASMKDNLERILKASFTFGVGSSVRGLEQVAASYAQASAAAGRKLYVGKSSIVMMDSLKLPERTPLLLDSNHAAPFSEAVKMGSAARASVWLAGEFGRIRELQRYDLQQCRLFCMHLVLLGSISVADLGLGDDLAGNRDRELNELLLHSETVDDMHALLLAHFTQLCEAVEGKRAQRSGNVVEKIKDIIQAQYAEPLSLGVIAGQVYLTTTYICLIFKQETGETINEYLTKVRLERAKELLLAPGSKLNKVCQAVGYPDASYFAKLFKKYTGHTPSEYKELAP